MVCSSCGYPAMYINKEWRHEDKDGKFFWLDPRSILCDNYGYPIDPITEDEWKIKQVERVFDGF